MSTSAMIWDVTSQYIVVRGQFTLGPKSQHASKFPTLKPHETIKIWLIIIKVGSSLFYATICRVCVGSSFLLDSTFNTSPKPCLQNGLPM